VCHHSFFSVVSACDVSPSCKLLGLFCYDFSPTTPASPRVSGFSEKVLVSSGVSPSCKGLSSFSHLWGQNYPQCPVLPHFWLLLCARSLIPFWRGSALSQCPVPDLSYPYRKDLAIHFTNSSPRASLRDLLNSLLFHGFCLRLLFLIPLLHSSFGYWLLSKFLVWPCF
jgi:hypothetical protein